MSGRSKWEYFRAIRERYWKATPSVKSRILDEYCQVCGYHRKYAIRKLNGELREPTRRRLPRRRGTSYSQRVINILSEVWKVAGSPCATRLKAIVRLWQPWIGKRFRLTPELEQQLLSISPRQIDRRLKGKKAVMRKRLSGRTKPGTLLKHQIAIKTDHWDVTRPGFTEVDLVAHCGNSADGEFVYSVNQTDLLTGWVETRAVLGRAQTRVLSALQQMQRAFPFPIRGIDSDNGSEFINHHLYGYCQQQKIHFTRGRPYKKNDNAHIEQKNWTQVRKLLGWERYDTAEAAEALNDLYANEWRLWQNLFLPSVKLIKKKRVGSKITRVYDQPLTPLDRLVASAELDATTAAQLQQFRAEVDPFALAATIEKKLKRIVSLAHRRLSPSNQAPARSSRRSSAAKTPGKKEKRSSKSGRAR